MITWRDDAEKFTSQAKRIALREKIAADVAAYLDSGGDIENCTNVAHADLVDSDYVMNGAKMTRGQLISAMMLGEHFGVSMPPAKGYRHQRGSKTAYFSRSDADKFIALCSARMTSKKNGAAA